MGGTAIVSAPDEAIASKLVAKDEMTINFDDVKVTKIENCDNGKVLYNNDGNY